MNFPQSTFHWFQKHISVVLIVTLLAPFVVKFEPAQSQDVAEEKNLAVILVEQNLYSTGEEDDATSLTGKIYRYAQDVQQALPDTKALILPVTAETSPQEIFITLENFYLEGQKKEDTVFFLQGIVLFGDVPLPMIDGVIPFPSIFPYTDFEKPAFLWDKASGLFTENTAGNFPKAEIWHGIIRGTAAEMMQYLDKNHDVHVKMQNGEAVSNDAVLYADLQAEEESISRFSLDQYEQGQEYSADKAYLRYTKNLLQKLQGALLKEVNSSEGVDDDNDGQVDEDPLDLEDNDGDGLVDEDDGLPEGLESFEEEDALQGFPDIHLKTRIEQLLPEYLQAIQNTAQDLRTRVENAGRWTGNQIDTLPDLITAMDILTRESLKDMNTFFEQKIIQFVEQEWQRDVRMVESVSVTQTFDVDTVYNRINGKAVPDITDPEECSLFRGSLPSAGRGETSQLIEYNRLYDPVASAGSGTEQCKPYGECCIQNQSQPQKCQPEIAQRPVFSWGGNAVSENGTEASFRDCQSLEWFVRNDDSGAPGTVHWKDISSVVVHDAPRPEHIANALENITAGHIPSDAIRHLTFQGPSGMLQRIDFPDTFTTPVNGENSWGQFIGFLKQEEQKLLEQVITDNMLLYAQYLFVKTEAHSENAPIVLTLPEEFLNRFRAYRKDMEVLFAAEFSENENPIWLWEQAIRADKEQFSRASENIFNRYFSFAENGTDGAEYKDIFAFWERGTEVLFLLGSRPNTALGLAREAQQGGENGVQKLTFSPATLPVADFFTAETETFNQNLISRLLQWKDLSVDEKHKAVIRLFFENTNTFVPRQKEEGYALAFFRSDGPENTLFWSGPDEEENDPNWNRLRQELAAGNSFGEDFATGGDDDENDDTENCGPVEGVDIWEWIPAVQCWLQSLQDLGVMIKRACGFEDAVESNGEAEPYRDPKSGDLVEPLSREDPQEIVLQPIHPVMMEGMSSQIEGQVLDSAGIKTAAGGRILSIFLEGPAELLETDADPDESGFQMVIPTGSFSLPIRATKKGTVTVRAEMEGLSPVETRIEVRDDLHMVLQQVNAPEEKADIFVYTLELLIRDQDGMLASEFTGNASVAISDPSMAFLGASTITVEKGKAILPVGVRSGPVTVTVTVPFLDPVSFEIGGAGNEVPERPTRLLFPNAPKFADLNSEIRIPLAVGFSSGRISSSREDIPENVVIDVAEHSLPLEIVREENEIIIQTGARAGKIYLSAQTEALLPALAEIQVGEQIGNEDIQELEANALITQLYGTPGADPLDPEALAARLLFSGKTQLVSGLIARGTMPEPRAVIRPEGQVEIRDQLLTSQISSTAPLQFKIVNPLEFESLAEFGLSLPDNALLSNTLPEDEAEAGIFFENFDTAGVLTSQLTDENMEIMLEEREILTIDTDLNFTFSDTRFSLAFDDSYQGRGVALNLLLDFSTPVGRFLIHGATTTFIQAFEIEETAEGGFFIPGALTAPEVSLFAHAQDDISQNVEGVGWEGEYLGSLLLAAGQSAGAALQNMATPLLLNWGDPTIQLSDAEQGSSGFDQTIGEQIFVSEESDFEEIRLADMDGDRREDIILRKGNGEILFLQNTGGSFRKWGPLLQFSDGIRQLELRKSPDGFSDLFLVDGKGTVHFLQNTGEVFSQEDLAVITEGAATIAFEDLDDDGFEDLIAQQTDGSLGIFYGSEQGYDENQNVVLDAILIDFSAAFEQSRTLVSSPSIAASRASFSFSDPRNEESSAVSFQVLENDSERNIRKQVQRAPDFNEDLLQVDITLPAQNEEMHLIDFIPSGFLYQSDSLLCSGCTEETVFVFPSGENGNFLQVWDLPANTPIGLRYFLRAPQTPAAEFLFEHVDAEGYPKDNILDITVRIPNAQANGVMSFVSTGRRSYRGVLRPIGETEKPENTPDMTADADQNGIPDIVEEVQDGWQQDADADGVPDYWDNAFDSEDGTLTIFGDNTEVGKDLNAIDGMLDFALSELNNSTCKNGSCIASPINYAFLVPGQTNAAQGLLQAASSVLQGGMTAASGVAAILNTFGSDQMQGQLDMLEKNINGALGPLADGDGILGGLEPSGTPIIGTLTNPPYVCSGTACNISTSLLRFYIAPTLTGGTGIAVCEGPYPTGECFAMALPLLSTFTDICETINEKVENFFSKASAAVSSSGTGDMAFVVDPVAPSGPSGSGSVQVTTNIGTIQWNSSPGRNVAPASSPGIFDRWISAQVKEIRKMFTLPNLTLILPDFAEALSTEGIDDLLDLGTQDFRNIARNIYEDITPKKEAPTETEGDESTIQTIQDLYQMLRAIPFLDIQEKTFRIAVPYMSMQRFRALEQDLHDWLDDAEAEIADWTDFVSNWECPDGASDEDCNVAGKAWEKMADHVETNYTTVRINILKNIATIQQYIDFANIVAHYDEELAEYIYAIICYLDAITDLLGGWFQTNLKRVQAWMVFYHTVPEIIRQWKALVKNIQNPVKECQSCKVADNYSNGGNVFSLVAGVLPDLPVITFPELPDIVVDLSQIKAGVVVEVPVLDFHPTPITFPQIPRLRLPRVPTVNILLPTIPLLPPPPPLPELPPFPSIPIPELPTIPPPPKLPQLSADISNIVSVVEKLLKIWCLFKKGIWMHQEMDLKPVIEHLTNRPASILLDIDFLNASIPDFSTETVEEIRVNAQVNFSLEFQEIVQYVSEIAEEWNTLVVEGQREIYNFVNEKFEFGDLLNFEDLIPEEIIIDTNPDPEILKEPTPRDPIPSDPVEPLENPGDPLSREFQKNLEVLHALINKQEETVSIEEVARNAGIVSPQLSGFSGSPAQVHLKKLRNALVSLQEKTVQRSENLQESKDIVALWPQETEGMTIEPLRENTMTAAIDVSVANPQSSPLVPFTPESFESTNFSLDQSEEETRDITAAQYQRQGIFLFDQELGQGKKIVTYPGFDKTVQQLMFSDVDGDGSDDLLILTPERLLLKTRGEKREPSHWNFPPEIGDFEASVPVREAVKNIAIDISKSEAAVAFDWDGTEQIAGVEIILKNTLTGYVRPNETATKYIEVLNPEFLDQGLETGEFFGGERTIQIAGVTKDISENEEIMLLEFAGPYATFPLDDGFWTMRMRVITSEGELGTLSEPFSLSRFSFSDTNQPLFLGEKTRRIPVFIEENISAEGFFDLESGMTFSWDFDRDGTADAEGYEVVVGPFEKPQQKEIVLTATDSTGNILPVTLTLDVFVPDISLEQSLLEDAIASGEVYPPVADMPFVLLRERFKTWKMVQTPSANTDGRYFTDTDGKYEIDDFLLSPDAVVKDTKGEIIARISGVNGRVFVEQNGYFIELVAGTSEHPAHTALYTNEGILVAVIEYVTPQQSDVFLTAEGFTAENVQNLEGTNIFDRNSNDAFVFGGLPADAPSFPGGGAIYDASSENILALISRQGDVRLLDSRLQFRLKQSADPEREPVVFEIVRNGAVLFELYVRIDWPLITLHHGENRALQSAAAESTGALFQDSTENENTSALPFSDLADDHRYYESIRELYERGVIEGFADGTFRPDQQITRAEFVKIVLGATTCADCTNPNPFEYERFFEPLPFSDAGFAEWYTFCLAKAKKLGFIEGYGDGLFRPDRSISRAESAAILLRAADIPLVESLSEEVLLRDVSPDAWYFPYILTALELGLVEVRAGGFVLPEQQISRGEFAFMADALLEIADCRDQDSDQDQMPDYWEREFGFDENDPTDAEQDADGDGVSNRDEYRNGTNPRSNDNQPEEPDPEILEFPQTDLCPLVPEDIDGVDDADGCPEIDVPDLSGLPAGIHIYPGDPLYCGFLDFLADIREGDTLKAAIMNTANSILFSESESYSLPVLFSPEL